MKAAVQAVDGYKRVIAIASFLLEGAAQAAGMGDHTALIGGLFTALGWDIPGSDIPVGRVIQVGFAVWALVDGFAKARRARAAQDDTVSRASIP